MAFWNISGAKVMGPAHIQTGTPCQDAFATGISDDGQWVSLVVSDGAGSAARAEEGSQLVAQVFSEKLLDIAKLLHTRVPGGWINDFVIQQVIHVRELLREKAGKDDIRDFHCTLVASLVGPSGGFLIHIGDGSLISGTVDEELCEEKKLHLKISNQSKPENGEYANETFFITEKDWIKHLRITPIGKVDWLMLATDGGCALSLQNESTPNVPNIQAMVQHLLNTPEASRAKAIEAWLGTDGAKQLSNDDKTFIICLGAKFQNYQGHLIQVTNEIVESQPGIQAPQAIPKINLADPVKVSTQGLSTVSEGAVAGASQAGTYAIPGKSRLFNLKTVLLPVLICMIGLYLLSLYLDDPLKIKDLKLNPLVSVKGEADKAKNTQQDSVAPAPDKNPEVITDAKSSVNLTEPKESEVNKVSVVNDTSSEDNGVKNKSDIKNKTDTKKKTDTKNNESDDSSSLKNNPSKSSNKN